MNPVDPPARSRAGAERKPKVTVVGDRGPFTAGLVELLGLRPGLASCVGFFGAADQIEHALREPLGEPGPEVAVYLAAMRGGGAPDQVDAEAVVRALVARGFERLVVVASQEVNTPSPAHPGMLSEARLPKNSPANRIAREWWQLERMVNATVEAEKTLLTVLRPSPVPTENGSDFWSRLLGRRLAVVVAGHDPSLQFLSLDDLGRAIGRAVEVGRPEVYNVAPRGVIPLRAAIRRSRARSLPLPHWLHRLGRRLLPGAAPIDQADHLRFSSTLSGDRAAEELGFEPRHTSAAAIGLLRGATDSEEAAWDDFGQDKDYIAAMGRTWHRFLFDRYWRVESRGLEHVPESGRAVLTGVHRGFMPFDGVMALEAVLRGRGRHTRFLIHPALVKFPFLATYLTRLGGMIACAQNADRVLRDEGLLGMFPEGIGGAFSYYRDAYRLRRFGRDEFVKMALRNRAPIVPFVTLGSAEIFPILAKINWRWWKRYTGWPCLPITPTFPLVPLPLPSKWHMRFLEPIHVERSHPPEAAADPAVVTAISAEVRRRLAEALAVMRRRRSSIFFGSIFEPRPDGEAET